MKLIEADKVEQAIKDYWKAQVDKALTLTFTNANEANNRINSYLEHNHELLKAIDELPSAQPDTTTHDSIPAETGKNDGDRTSGDCISRQRSVDTLRKMQTYKLFAGDDMLLINQAEAQTELMMLPPVQPEHKTGRWTLRRVTYLWEGVECEKFETRCSSCGCLPISGIKSTYCPNCGADMRGEG